MNERFVVELNFKDYKMISPWENQVLQENQIVVLNPDLESYCWFSKLSEEERDLDYTLFERKSQKTPLGVRFILLNEIWQTEALVRLGFPGLFTLYVSQNFNQLGINRRAEFEILTPKFFIGPPILWQS